MFCFMGNIVFSILSRLSLGEWLTVVSIISAVVLGVLGIWKICIQIQKAIHERDRAKLEFQYRKEQLEMEWWEKQAKRGLIK